MSCGNVSGPAYVSGAECAASVTKHPFHIAVPMRDVGVALIVGVQRDDFTFGAEPNLQLPAKEPKQFEAYTSLEPYDHSALPRY